MHPEWMSLHFQVDCNQLAQEILMIRIIAVILSILVKLAVAQALIVLMLLMWITKTQIAGNRCN